MSTKVIMKKSVQIIITTIFLLTQASFGYPVLKNSTQGKTNNDVYSASYNRNIQKKQKKEKKKIHVCFTPEQNCTSRIIRTINQAKEQILVQAYSFTSKPIAKALIKAKKRGVQVKIILDKSQCKARNSSLRLFVKNNIPVWIDSAPAIAHNKILIVDNRIYTGSFNFTNAAQYKNTENLVLIEDNEILKRYIQNWNKRFRYSSRWENYCKP